MRAAAHARRAGARHISCRPVPARPAGAQPTAALATVVVPLAAADKMEDDLYQMTAGVLRTLRAAGCELVGGHSSEGAEMALGAHGTG